MNIIFGFFVGIWTAMAAFFGIHSDAQPVNVGVTGHFTEEHSTMSPEEVVAQYGTLPKGLEAVPGESLGLSGLSVYANTEYGFSVTYPKSLKPETSGYGSTKVFNSDPI